MVTAGAQAALDVVAQAFLGPGDAALVPDPGFPAYRILVELAGAEALPYRHDARWQVDAAVLISVLERTPRAVREGVRRLLRFGGLR